MHTIYYTNMRDSNGALAFSRCARLPEPWPLLWAVTFIPMRLPRKVIQTSYCTHLLFENVMLTGLGMDMGMGMNGTAHASRKQGGRARHRATRTVVHVSRGGNSWVHFGQFYRGLAPRPKKYLILLDINAQKQYGSKRISHYWNRKIWGGPQKSRLGGSHFADSQFADRPPEIPPRARRVFEVASSCLQWPIKSEPPTPTRAPDDQFRKMQD